MTNTHRTHHRRSAQAWARNLAGSEAALVDARKILAALAGIENPGELALREIRQAELLVDEFVDDVDDVIARAIEDGYGPDDFGA